MASRERDQELRAALAMLAPGTQIREGIERVIHAHRGTLLVLGWDEQVEQVASGGFDIDTKVTAQRLSELAKMDGALVVDPERNRILRANVHLVPDSSVSTTETGTRHRSAERVARQTGLPVVSVSESMQVVTLYLGNRKRQLEEVATLLFRANQALSTLERYRTRLDEVATTLSAREVEDVVTLRDVVTVLQRAEMVRRIAAEVEDYVDELGTEGRLIRLQLEELIASVDDERSLIVEDYLADRRKKVAGPLAELGNLHTDELLDLERIAQSLGHEIGLDEIVTPRGFRLLSKIPRLPDAVIGRLVAKFQTLQRVMDAGIDDLTRVDGVGEARAHTIQDGLRRLAESSLLERYV